MAARQALLPPALVVSPNVQLTLLMNTNHLYLFHLSPYNGVPWKPLVEPSLLAVLRQPASASCRR